ncbi:MAG: helix-turn-helix domain-containing protein [Burkholderiales bacterium]|nr:helix-turn-helix domain-containing protein [Burkholderiales bacterium]
MKTIYHPQYVALIESLIQARKALSLTQLQLATILGKQQSYIAKVEICERKLDVLEFIEWCRALEQVPSDLIKQIENN